MTLPCVTGTGGKVARWAGDRVTVKGAGHRVLQRNRTSGLSRSAARLGRTKVKRGAGSRPGAVVNVWSPPTLVPAALIATSRDTGVPCTCVQNRRWDSDFLTLQRVIEGDLVGTVVRFESRFER